MVAKLGDLQGNFTCFGHRGEPSVIDYMICDSVLYDCVEYFKVHELMPHSIHCMTACTILADQCCTGNTQDDTLLHEIPIQYCWTSKSAELWNWSLNHDCSQFAIKNFVNNSLDPQISVDDCLQEFNTLLQRESIKMPQSNEK